MRKPDKIKTKPLNSTEDEDLTMGDLAKLEKEGLVEEFNLREDEIFEAKYNLLGFFGTLYKIDQRLKKKQRETEEAGSNA